MRKSVLTVFILLLLNAPLIWADDAADLAEFDAKIAGTNPGQNLELEPPTAQGVGVNGQEAEVLQNVVFGQQGPQFNAGAVNNADMSGKYGSTGAAGKSDTGKAHAIATGATLMATGVPMAGSPIASVRAAGLALIAKASLEFAQAAANARASKKNRNIENQKLRFDDNAPQQALDTSGVQQQTIQEIAGQITTPELEKLLTERGVNSEDFVQQIASGELRTEEDIARAIGDTTDLSSEELAAGRELASQELSKGSEDVLRVASDESAEENPLGQGKNLGLGDLKNGSLAGVPQPGLGDLKAGQVAEVDHGTLDETVRGLASEGSGAEASGSALPGVGNLKKFWKKYGKKGRRTQKKNVLANWNRDQLKTIGVLKNTAGDHIFKKAHRSFRSFRRWREKKLLSATARIPSQF